MAKDKVTEALLEALRQALAEPRDQPLVKIGKQPGLFAGKSGANGEDAAAFVKTVGRTGTMLDRVVSPRVTEYAPLSTNSGTAALGWRVAA